MKINISAKESTTVRSWTSNRKSYYYFDMSYKDIEIKEYEINGYNKLLAINEALYIKLYDEFCRSGSKDKPSVSGVNGNYNLKFYISINSIKDFIAKTPNIIEDYHTIKIGCLESKFDKEKHLFEDMGFKISSKDYPNAEDCLCESECTCIINEDEYINVWFVYTD